MGAPLADAELVEYRQRGGRTVNSSFFYHYARLIEILAAIEFIEALLDDPDMHATTCAPRPASTGSKGVGVSEAPRGTLFHHYQVDENGLLKKVNLIIATGQNNLAMNRTITQIAQHFIKGDKIPETVLNRVEAGIRAFDPCLSCSTHAAGQMPLIVRLIAPDGARPGRGATPMTPFLVIGYGNELRGDDAAGPCVARGVADWGRPEVDGLAVHQLTPELAPALAGAEVVVFVDACADDEERKVCAAPAGGRAGRGHGPHQRSALAVGVGGGAVRSAAGGVAGDDPGGRLRPGHAAVGHGDGRRRGALLQIDRLVCAPQC